MSHGVLKRLLLAGLSCLILGDAAAHTRSTSYSVWDLTEAQTPVLSVRITEFDLTRLQLHPEYTPDFSERLQAILNESLVLVRDGQICSPDSHLSLQRREGELIARQRLSCGETGEYQIQSRLLVDNLSSHLHFAQVLWPNGQRQERLLTDTDDHWQPTQDGRRSVSSHAPASLMGFVTLGVEHILSGWDHLAFLLGLLLLATNLVQVLWLITGFTLAHSLTLGMAVVGGLQPNATAIELLIAWSIVFVGVEVIWQHTGRPRQLVYTLIVVLLGLALIPLQSVPGPVFAGMALFSFCYFRLLERGVGIHRLRAVIAFAFGLLHGFGFAGVLLELSLPEAGIAWSLLGFNLGVEAGQICMVLLIWPLLQWLRRGEFPAVEATAASVAGMGCYWFVLRLFTG